MTELDKFKRRMIRSVAWQLIKEKKPEEEMWNTVKTETGSNCKKLWHRMRALTLKKLKRLFEADDNDCVIPSFAKMSETDWLMFDLVLVHEDEDIIGKDKMTPNSKRESVVLTTLFTLVQRFNLEDRGPESLTGAWSAATRLYNSAGHKVTPMLMQRRWYQLKQYTRERFYNFWYAYRGNSRLWEKTQSLIPTVLQQAIALRYPKIITAPFPSWEEAIKEKLIILPEEFENHNRTDLPKPCDENSPDLVLIEPAIETIDLEQYSTDDEKSDECNSDTIDEESISTYKVKIEPEDSDIGIEYAEEPSSLANMSLKVMNILREEETLLNDDVEKLQNKEINVVPGIDADENQVAKVTIIKNNNLNINVSETVNETLVELCTCNTDTFRDICSSCSSCSSVEEQEEETIQENIPDITIDSNKKKSAQSTDTMLENETLKDTYTSFEDGIPKITNVFGNVDITNDALINSLTKCTELINDRILPVLEKEVNEDCEIINLDDTPETINDVTDTIIPNVHSEIQHEDIIKPDSDEDVTNSVEDVTQRVEDVTETVDDVTETVKYVTGTVEDVIEKVEDVTEKVEDVTERVEDVTERVEDVTEIVEDLTETVENATETVEDVTKTVEGVTVSVGDVTVSEISNCSPLKDIDKRQTSFGGTRNYLDFIEDGIELVDDGIEYVEDDELHQKPNILLETDTEVEKKEDLIECKEVTFDLKLLMQAVVYTTKLDIMNVFKDTCFETVASKSIIDLAILESKPVSTKSLNLPSKVNSDNYNASDVSSDYENYEIDDNMRVNLSNNLLKKPKNLSYNPIQLCKNPDFNTRLKRLTAGFFSSSRNRFLLKVCKPMTIDMSKAFESKLVNGVMYLKSSTTTDSRTNDSNYNKSSSVVPSAMPAQSLMDNAHLKDFSSSLKSYDHTVKTSLSTDDAFVERKKTINLPNMSQVRLSNQRLLTAEVSPFQVVKTKISNHESSEDIVIQTVNNNTSNNNTPNNNTPNNNTLAVNKTFTNHEPSENVISQPREVCNNTSFNHPKLTTNIPPDTGSQDKNLNDIKENEIIISNTPRNSEVCNNTSFNNPKSSTNIPPNTDSQDKNLNNIKENEIIISNTPRNLGYRDNTGFLTVNNENPSKCIANNSCQSTNVSKNSTSSITEIRNSQCPKNIERPSNKKDQRPPNKKYPRQIATTVSWNKKIIYPTVNDALLTHDTLTKMLLRINGGLNYVIGNKKLTALWNKNKTQLYEDEQNVDTTINKKTVVEKKKRRVYMGKPNNKLKKPKITVSHGNKNTSFYEGEECCWARNQINKINETGVKTSKKHYCKSISNNYCNCCCKYALQEIRGKEKELKNACDTIESVVQQTGKTTFVRAKKRKTTKIIKEQKDPDIVELSDDPNTHDTYNRNNSNNIQTNVTIDLDGENTDDSINVHEDYDEHYMDIDKVTQTPPVSALPTCDYFVNQNTETAITNRIIQIPVISTAIRTNSNDNPYLILGQHTAECANKYSQTHRVCLCQQKSENFVQVSRIRDTNKKGNSSTKEKILILSGKQISNRKVESPICLGKNKILVSTVKFPSPNSIIKSTPNEVASSVPVISGSKGLEMILPNGEQALYSYEPDIDVDLSGMSTIAETVKRTESLTDSPALVLDASPNINILTSSTEVVDTNKNESNVLKENTVDNSRTRVSKSMEKETAPPNNELDKSKDIDRDKHDQLREEFTCKKQFTEIFNEENVNMNIEIKVSEFTSSKESSILPNESLHPVNETEQLLNTTSPTDTQIADTNKRRSSVNEINITGDNELHSTNRNSLLSDLMEMSGISAEDVTLSENVVQEEPASNMFILDTPIANSPDQNQISNTAIPNSELTMQNYNNVIQVSNLPQLNPVTSYSDLKYACENNGLFFKLDYDTKTLVPIKVCIRKTFKQPKEPLKPGKVIDLTDEIDDDNSPNDQIDDIHRDKINNRVNKNSVLKSPLIKPLKAFKAIHSPIILRKSKTTVLKSPPMSLLKNYDKKITPINKLNINSINTDDSGDDLNIKNSSNEESSHRKRKHSSDSSDDEPLIAKVKRKQMSLDSSNKNDAPDLVGTNEQINKIEISNTIQVIAETELPHRTEIPENESARNAAESTPLLDFISDNTEVDEDCILGV